MEDVYKVVETMPQFTGGEEARIKYMISSVKYPDDAKEKGIQGTVYVSFIVEKDGKISGAKVVKGIGKSCDEEALRVVKAMPKWIPGTQKGKPVRVQFNMPIRFKLS
jgi:protein TonB